MRTLTAVSSVLVLQFVVACGGAADQGPDAPDVPTLIERSIATGCKDGVKLRRFPNDEGHKRVRQLAEEAFVIACEGTPIESYAYSNLSAYARFDSPEKLKEALGAIELPPARSENLCVTGSELFSLEFRGSDPTCARAGGEPREIREPPEPSSATRRTYAPPSGTTYHLVSRPRIWSSGGTGGSDTARNMKWERWRWSGAFGTGTASLRGPCHPNCPPQAARYEAPARVRLDRPLWCIDQGVRLRYFARARFSVYMRPGNPFGEPVGWLTRTWWAKAYKGECRLNTGPPISG